MTAASDTASRPPIVVDAAGPRRPWPEPTELWRFRGLLAALIARDVTVRYRQAVVGVAWAVLQPLTQLALWAALFGFLGRTPATGGTPYLLSALCGLVCWQFVATTITNAGTSLLNNREMVTKVYFPRAFLPIAAAGAAAVDTLVGLGCLIVAIGVAWVAGVPLTFDAVGLFVGLPLGLATLLLATGGFACALAGWTALYRDFRFVTPFLVQVLFFLTPVIYEAGLVAERFPGSMPLWAVQPYVGGFALLRWGLIGHDPPGPWAIVSVLSAVAVAAGGLAALTSASDEIADRI